MAVPVLRAFGHAWRRSVPHSQTPRTLNRSRPISPREYKVPAGDVGVLAARPADAGCADIQVTRREYREPTTEPCRMLPGRYSSSQPHWTDSQILCTPSAKKRVPVRRWDNQGTQSEENYYALG